MWAWFDVDAEAKIAGGRVITLVFFMRRHGLCMLALDGTFAQAEMPVYPRILHFFVTKCVHVYPDGRLVSGSKMGPCRRIFNAGVLTRPLAMASLRAFQQCTFGGKGKI